MDGIIWKGSPNHYTGRQGYGVTHITLHIMVGYLAGTDATFANSASQASAHYGIGADGTIHQYVSERDGSYSDANYVSNNSTISIEHEGGMAAGAVCTQACIDALVKKIGGANALSWTDTNTAKGKTYYYYVRAFKGNYYSAASKAVNVKR